MKYESVKKTNSSYGLEIAGAYTPTPRSSVFRKQSSKPSLTNNESMGIHVKTPAERNSNGKFYYDTFFLFFSIRNILAHNNELFWLFTLRVNIEKNCFRRNLLYEILGSGSLNSLMIVLLKTQ